METHFQIYYDKIDELRKKYLKNEYIVHDKIHDYEDNLKRLLNKV